MKKSLTLFFGVFVILVFNYCTAQAQDVSAKSGDGTISLPPPPSDNQIASTPNAQPVSRNSTTMDRIVQTYSNILKGNFFSGKSGEYQFKGSFYAIGNALNDSAWVIDTTYLKEWNRALRNTEVDLGFKMDESGGISSFSPSVKFALNNRDRTDMDFFTMMHSEYLKIDNELTPKIRQIESIKDTVERAKQEAQFRNSLQGMKKKLSSMYDSLANILDQRALVTLAVGADIAKSKGDSLGVELEYYHGIFLGSDLVLRGGIGFQDTSTKTSTDFQRVAYKLSAGTDVVVLKYEKTPLIDIAASLEYSGILKGLLPKEDKNSLDISLTMSSLVSQGVSVPFTVKYDPKHGNFLGFLEVQWNFEPSQTQK